MDGVAIVSMHDFFKQNVILAMVAKILEEHVLFTLGQCMTIIVPFDFLMFKLGHNIIALVINFLNSN
jgi:hypothetical protein